MIIEKCKKIITRLGWNEKNTYLCYMKNKTKTNIVFGLIFGLVGILGITMFISIM
jgi:hypothetical protein